jgi:hypothetical protein
MIERNSDSNDNLSKKIATVALSISIVTTAFITLFLGVVTIVPNAKALPYFSDDMESGVGGWMHYQISGMSPDFWAQSTARNHSQVISWYSDPEPGGLFGDTALETPSIDLTLATTASLSFWHWYEFDGDGPTSTYGDGGIVEVNISGVFTQIYPEHGYDNPITITGFNNPLEGYDAFTLSSGGWVHEVFNITNYIGSILKIRFHVGYDDGSFNAFFDEGWYIDDVVVEEIDYLTVSHIPKPSVPAYQGTYVVTDQLILSASQNSINVSSMRVDLFGIGPPTSVDVRRIMIYHDSDDDGEYDAGSDQYLSEDSIHGSGGEEYSILYIEGGFVVNAGAPESILIILSIKYSAIDTRTVGTEIKTNMNISLNSGDIVSTDNFPITSNEFPIDTYVPTSIQSTWAWSPPTIDGALSVGEWDGAMLANMSTIPVNNFSAQMYMMNDDVNLYVSIDAVGDTVQDDDIGPGIEDYASLYFDTLNDVTKTHNSEDLFFIGAYLAGPTAHYIYNGTLSLWQLEDAPFNTLLPDHATLAGDWGFGPSAYSATAHRSYEFQIPLALVNASAGDVLAVLARVKDFSIPGNSTWPHCPYDPSIRLYEYGDIALATPGGPPSLSSGSVTPTTGAANATDFVYRVDYNDADNNPPLSVDVLINKTGSNIGTYPMVMEAWLGAPDDWTAGATFNYSTTLALPGIDYTYVFRASDMHGEVYSTEQDNPDVSPNTPPDAPINLGVQGFMTTPDIMNITDHNPALNWTFVDPDIEPQSGYNVTVWDSTKTTLYWFSNITSFSESDFYNSTGTATANLTDGQDYWFRVQTNDSSDSWSPWSEVMFHMNSQPPAPTHVSPPDDSQQPAGGQTLTWNPVVDAEGSSITYYWYVSLDPAFSVLESSGSTPATFDSFPTFLGMNYYWRVQAYDGYEFGLNSTAWNFTTPAGNNPPDMPSGLGVQAFVASPGILNITDHTPDLNWTFSDPDGGDTQGAYNVTVWTAPGGTGTLMYWDNQTSAASSVVYSGTPLVDGIDYYLRVMTMDNNGLWGAWAEKMFHMNTPPPTPTLVSPPDDSQQAPGIQVLDWNGVTDAEGSSLIYYWYVSTDPGFPLPLDAEGTNPGTSDSFMSFPSNNYYWRVRAFDGYEFGLNSTTWNFSTPAGNNPPNAPTNLGVQGFTSAPAIMNITDHTPDLNWTFSDTDVGDTQSGYNVTVTTGPGGLGTMMFWSNQTSTSQTATYSGSSLMDGDTYYLRVKTKDFTGLWGPWAEKMFRMNTLPPMPTLLEPPDGTIDLDEGPQDLNWTEVTDAEGSPITYHWYVAADPGFLIMDSWGTTGSPPLGLNLQLMKTYYWRVRAFDGYEYGSNSSTFMFKTHYNGSMAGTVKDSNGVPMEAALILILSTSYSTVTDAAGNYSITGITPGTYNVAVSKPGYSATTKSVTITAGEQNVTDFTLVITRSSISGTVQDENGDPVEGATVKLFNSENVEIGTATTNSTGGFVFEDLNFGSYTVKVTKEGYDEYSEQVNIISFDPVVMDPIELKKSEEPFPLWIIIVIVIIVVVIILLLLYFMTRKKDEEIPEEGESREEFLEDEAETRWSESSDLEEEELAEDTEETDERDRESLRQNQRPRMRAKTRTWNRNNRFGFV